MNHINKTVFFIMIAIGGLTTSHSRADDQDSSINRIYISGLASAFGVVDRVNDVVLPGAYTEAVRSFNAGLRAGGQTIRMYPAHDFNFRIGEWTQLAEVEDGLYVEGYVDLDRSETQKWLSTLRQQSLSRGVSLLSYIQNLGKAPFVSVDEATLLLRELGGLSIGYNVVKSRNSNGIRYIEELKVVEISLTADPVNRGAYFELRPSGFSRSSCGSFL